jgi:thiol-disulfide isomerase/thioredoxin
MRLLMTMLLGAPALMLAGCDKASKPAGQGQEIPSGDRAASVPSGSRADIGLESSSGLSAVLTYSHAGQAAPEAAFIGVDGRDVRLSDFSGRPLLVNIWATWCAPCKAEMPTLDMLAALEAGKLSVIAISQDLEGREPVAAYFAQSKLANLEPYIDPQNGMLAALGNNVALPTTILYNSDGKEVWRVSGGVEWDDAEMTSLLAEAN